jgi:hypothetical protein
MAKYRGRLVIIVLVALVASALVVWMTFQPATVRVVVQNRALIVVGVCAMFIPLGFYPVLAARVPRLAIGLSFLAAGAIAAACAAIAGLIFDVQNAWVTGTDNLSFILWAMAALAFIWQWIRTSKVQQGKQGDRRAK